LPMSPFSSMEMSRLRPLAIDSMAWCSSPQHWTWTQPAPVLMIHQWTKQIHRLQGSNTDIGCCCSRQASLRTITCMMPHYSYLLPKDGVSFLAGSLLLLQPQDLGPLLLLIWSKGSMVASRSFRSDFWDTFGGTTTYNSKQSRFG
jgi:hypothetical protein